jgi:hypothetical protein
MSKYEYHIHETEFRRETPEMLAMYFDAQGKASWELVFMIPLQTIDNRNVLSPGVVNIKISFLCIFKRRKSILRSWIQKISSVRYRIG